MTRNCTRTFLSFLILSTIVACGSVDQGAAEVATITSALTDKVIYFGRLEVLAGQLKSAYGTRAITRRNRDAARFLPELSNFMCATYCMALYPTLYVRYTGSSVFHEVPGIAPSSYNVPVIAGQWHTLEATAVGAQITITWDGTQVISVMDQTYTNGKIGLWTKADSVTAFDDLEATAL